MRVAELVGLRPVHVSALGSLGEVRGAPLCVAGADAVRGMNLSFVEPV